MVCAIVSYRQGLVDAWWERVYDHEEDDDERLAAASHLAISLKTQGKYPRAEVLLCKVLKTKEQEFGAEHRDTLITKGNLTAFLLEHDKYAALLFQVLGAQERMTGPEHHDTLKKGDLSLWAGQVPRGGGAAPGIKTVYCKATGTLSVS